MRPRPTTLSEEEITKLKSDAQAKKLYTICGYVSANRDGTITVCKNQAGKGTPHPGQDNCKWHGGYGRKMTTGNQSAYKPELVKTLFDKVAEYKHIQEKDHDESLKYATILVEELSKIDLQYAPIDKIEMVRRVLETKIKAEDLQLKRKEKGLITVEEVSLLLQGMLSVLEEEIKDIGLRKRITLKLKDRYLALPSTVAKLSRN
jgi:hypothetical protein